MLASQDDGLNQRAGVAIALDVAVTALATGAAAAAADVAVLIAGAGNVSQSNGGNVAALYRFVAEKYFESKMFVVALEHANHPETGLRVY